MLKENENLDWIRLEVFIPEGDFNGAFRKGPHVHSDLELLYIMEGRLDVTVEDKTYCMAKEDILLINALREHTIQVASGSESQSLICCIHISQSFLGEYTGNGRMLFWCNSMMENDSSIYGQLRRILNNILIDCVNGQKERYFFRYSQYYSLLHILVDYCLVTGDDIRLESRAGSEDGRLSEILEYIELNYNKELSLNKLADTFFLSVSYLSKYLKKKLGMNFVDYLYTVRLRYAMEDLLSSEEAITHIALNHGYPSIGAFNRQFKAVYGCTPSQYRQRMRNDISRAEQEKKQKKEQAHIEARLKQHFKITPKAPADAGAEEMLTVTADASDSRPYEPVWNNVFNIGEAGVLLGANAREAVLYVHKILKNKYVRFWGIFYEDMQIPAKKPYGRSSFGRLDQIINFLLENGMKPFIDIGEKPRRILSSPQEFVKEIPNGSRFLSYDEFLQCLEALMEHLVSYYGRAEVESWRFELWEDKRVEVYADKVPYMTLFKDCRRIIKGAAPLARFGGAGNYMGWYKEHTEECLQKWIDSGVYPDFLTQTYYPYALGDFCQERFSKRKSDENDFIHALDELHHFLWQYNFPTREIMVTDWNMTVSSRNYFNDSLWKGCYVLKCSLASVGSASQLVYSQLVDTTTDYPDRQRLINGSGGLLNRDMIEKPAFIAMRMLGKLYHRVISRGENYIITDNGENDYAILMFHFIGRNYLYYAKPENENTVEEHYKYFEHQNSLKMAVELKSVSEGVRYAMRQYILNRENGSLMDEWVRLSCVDMPTPEDIEYLRKRCTPRESLTYIDVKNQKLKLEFSLKPLEMRLVLLKAEL